MTRDQIEAQTIICTPYLKPSNDFKEYDRIYPFATENIKGYMQDLEGKSVLTVRSSGDHKLNALSLGAKQVDTFDINRLTKKYTELKEEIIKHFNYEQFLNFLNNSKLYYDQIKYYLNPETKEFWDWYFHYFIYTQKSMFKTSLFYSMDDIKRNERINHYLDEGKFKRLKNHLLSKEESKDYTLDVNELPQALERQYDVIYLSNIINYQRNLYTFKETILTLYHNFLKEHGSIYYGYYYADYEREKEPYLDEMPNSEVLSIPSMTGAKTDKILVLRK